MLMELIYRLAVEESPFVQSIRENLIFMTTPVLEVDGRDKRVDLLKIKQSEEDAVVPRLLYWGKYVAHDNNRDGMILQLELSKMLMRTFMEYKPQVLHDLHESASHLYTSTGTGPYNAWLDPILIDEWHVLAYQEITELTKLGVPGVWTHNFYDGWAPNYGFYAANGHNSIGRFYETQGAGDADTRVIRSNATRAWYRPNPPLPVTMWSIRNNVNMQQAGLLIAMNYMANNRKTFMKNFYLKGKRSIAKPANEGRVQQRPSSLACLIESRLLSHGCDLNHDSHITRTRAGHYEPDNNRHDDEQRAPGAASRASRVGLFGLGLDRSGLRIFHTGGRVRQYRVTDPYKRDADDSSHAESLQNAQHRVTRDRTD